MVVNVVFSCFYCLWILRCFKVDINFCNVTFLIILSGF